MKYIHGTDVEQHDRLMVWGNRLLFVIFLSAFLFFAAGIVFILVYLIAWDGELSSLWGLLMLIPGAAFILDGLLWTAWSNARYSIDEQGITLDYLFQSKFYPWSVIKTVFFSPIRRTKGVAVIKPPKVDDYFVLMISECGALTRGLFREDCWRYRAHFLVVRYSEERLREFERYVSISEKPDIPAYKYFL